MPELRLTESQWERLDALQEELAAEHAGPYASVRQQDAIDYLLDLAEEINDPRRRLDLENDAPSGSTETNMGDNKDSSDNNPAGRMTAASEDVAGDGDSPSDSLTNEGNPSAEPVKIDSVSDVIKNPDGILDLLERHDDKWQEGTGEERYEVKLDDGTIETARTKDDVKAILFRHY